MLIRVFMKILIWHDILKSQVLLHPCACHWQSKRDVMGQNNVCRRLKADNLIETDCLKKF